jgi:two-component system KDP operon response regulator KdpE
MTEQTILIIDDDETLLELLADHIRMSGYRPLVAGRGTEGLRLAEHEKPDLIVLDVMMPGMDGWEVCQQLRQNSSVPVIMLTAKGEELDKLRGFRLGVDDYVTKPFSFAELAARIGAVLSRVREATSNVQQRSSGDLSINLDQRRVTLSGQVVDLTPTEYRLFEVLARHANSTVPTEELLEQVWGAEYAGEVEHVKHYIWSLRRKLESDPGDPKHIITERGFGYRFE